MKRGEKLKRNYKKKDTRRELLLLKASERPKSTKQPRKEETPNGKNCKTVLPTLTKKLKTHWQTKKLSI